MRMSLDSIAARWKSNPVQHGGLHGTNTRDRPDNQKHNSSKGVKRKQITHLSDSSLIEVASSDIGRKGAMHDDEKYDGVDEISRRELDQEARKRGDGRKTKNFEKRARHKMGDPATKTTKHKPATHDRADKSRPKRKKKGEITIRNKSDVLIEGFSAENISDQRITVRQRM